MVLEKPKISSGAQLGEAEPMKGNTIRFPSTEWFLALKESAELAPTRCKRVGSADLTLVIKIDFVSHAECYELAFEGDLCNDVRRISCPRDAASGAVVIEGSEEVWREMVENIQRNGKADLAHTLNSLTLRNFPLRVFAANQLDVDKSHCYRETLQEFLDGASRFLDRMPTPA